MWRLFPRFLLLSLLQYATAVGDKIPIEDCPKNKVCAFFRAGVSCNVDSVRSPYLSNAAGYVYEDSSSCDVTINDVNSGEKTIGREFWTNIDFARLDIEPVSLRNWSFVMTHWDAKEADIYFKDGDRPHLDNIGFDFHSAKIEFPTKTEAQLKWRDSPDAEWQTTNHALVFLKEFNSHQGHTFMQYSFNIASEEKLASLLGKKKFSYDRMRGAKRVFLNDNRFLERLDSLSPCDPEELKGMSVCHGGCDTVRVSNETTDVSCTSNSTFWFHNTKDALFTRKWLPADKIKCWLGSYEAHWDKGFQVLTSTMEVQCSTEQPTRLMALGIGLMAGGGALLFVCVAAITGYFVYKCCIKKRDIRSHSDAPTFSTPSTPGRFMSTQSKR